MNNYIDLVLLAAIFFTFNIMADAKPKINDVNIECKTHLFVGGPIKTNISIKDELVSVKLSCPLGKSGFKLPEFPEFDNLLHVLGQIEKEEFVESLTLSNIDATSCSNAATLTTLVGCFTLKPAPLLLVIGNTNSKSTRQINLVTESSYFSSARRSYERASGNSIRQYFGFDVEIRFRFKTADNKYYYPRFFKTFSGENGCLSK